MVSQVVQVLDEGNPFMSPTRVLHSRVRKIQRKRKPIRPATGAGKVDAFEKHKERQRKQAKDTHPNVSLRWNDGAKRWLVRQQENDEILRQTEHLNEISLRTIGIGASLGLVKSWSSKATQEINKLKSLGTLLRSASNDSERAKLYGEIVGIDAAVFDALRKMLMYSATLTTSGLIGLERTLIKKLTFTKQRRKR